MAAIPFSCMRYKSESKIHLFLDNQKIPAVQSTPKIITVADVPAAAKL